MNNVDDFYENGFLVIDDFLDESRSSELLNRFKKVNSWIPLKRYRNSNKNGGKNIK